MTSTTQDPKTLYLYTSLTAGSSHIITATSRLETILKANKVPFVAIDVATDDRARSIWGRRSGGKRLPGLVKDEQVLGNLDDIEDWNEHGELKDNLLPEKDHGKILVASQSTDAAQSGLKTAVDTSPIPGNPPAKSEPNPMAMAMSNVAAEAAAAASGRKKAEALK